MEFFPLQRIKFVCVNLKKDQFDSPSRERGRERILSSPSPSLEMVKMKYVRGDVHKQLSSVHDSVHLVSAKRGSTSFFPFSVTRIKNPFFSSELCSVVFWLPADTTDGDVEALLLFIIMTIIVVIF